MSIHEFSLNTRIENTPGDMYLAIEMLGPLGEYLGALHYPIEWRDIDDDGIKPEVMERVKMIVSRLNAPQTVVRRMYAESEMMMNDVGIEFP